MPTTASLQLLVRTTDDVIRDQREPVRHTCGALLPQREKVSLAGTTFTALSPPTGARAVVIFVGENESLTLKGVTGDSGINLTPASAVPGFPVCLPISSPSIGLYNGGDATTVEVLWL